MTTNLKTLDVNAIIKRIILFVVYKSNKISKLDNGNPTRKPVGITLDDEVLSLVDEIITSMAATSRQLMNRLTHLGFIPKGQIPTLIFAAFLFVYNYNEARKDSTISESLEISKAITFGNPILQRFFAEMSAQTVNEAIVK